MESKKETTYKYKVEDSAKRMDDILNASDNDYEDNDYTIPSRDKLTYKNGFYVNITALFIDIVDSSSLTDGRKRPTLAKMYRSFLSECVAIINGSERCKEININGDCVWGVFETSKRQDVENVVFVAAQLHGMINILNYKLRKKGYDEISVGIGVDIGRALMVKAGYAGSGINDVIWMGDVVNSACHLGNEAGRDSRKAIIISSEVYDFLSDEAKGRFSEIYSYYEVTKYESNCVAKDMNAWYRENCK